MTPIPSEKNRKNFKNDNNVIVDNSVEIGDFFYDRRISIKKNSMFFS